MNAYCRNNPVNYSDPTGKYAISLLGLAVAIAITIVITFAIINVVNKPSFRNGVSNAVSAVGNAINSAISRAKSNVDSSTNTNKKTSQPIKIYRYGGTNPGNLTPKPKDRYSGLSFSRIPQPGAAVTTIEELNATGIVYAVQDGPAHVSVRPVNGTMDDWIEEGSKSTWTRAVKSVIAKWDGAK